MLAAESELVMEEMVSCADPGSLLLVAMVLRVDEMMREGLVSSADRLSLPFVVELVGEAEAACWLA